MTSDLSEITETGYKRSMVPPIWLDEFGRRRPVRPCSRCGQDTPILRFRIEHLHLVGWRLFAPAEFVNWCGHAQEFVPVLGEAS